VPPLPDPRRGGGRHREAGQDQCRRFSSLAIVQVTMNMPGTKGLGGHTAPYRGAVRAVRHRGLRARIVSLSLSGLPSSTQQSHAAGLAAAGRGVGCFSEVVPSSLGWLGGGPDTFGVPCDGLLVHPSGTVVPASGVPPTTCIGPTDVSTTVGPLHVSGQWWDSNPRANPHTLHDAYPGLGDCHGPRGHLTRSSSDPHGLQLVRP
jgi:hypothetical protein